MNQRSIQRENTSVTCSMDVYKDPKRSRSKESNQAPSNYHRQNHQYRSHICTPNTYHTSQVNQKDPRAPQDHTKNSISPSNGQTPPQCGDIHGFFLCLWDTITTYQIKEDIFQFSPRMQQKREIRNYIFTEASEYRV